MEAWEATYSAMVSQYLQMLHATHSSQGVSRENIQTHIIESMATLHNSDSSFSASFNKAMQNLDQIINFNDFLSFVDKMAKANDTWKFWGQFVLQDCMGYVSFFLAIRSGNWNLRLAGMKLMAPVFSAFDHQTYQSLISRHLADVLCMPPELKMLFEQGAFVVSVSGNPWHSVGIDEAHEMLINRECKASVVRPSGDYISRMAQYIPYRSQAMRNLREQLFREEGREPAVTSPFTTRSNEKKFMANVQSQLRVVQQANVFNILSKNRGLYNPYTSTVATPAQAHDLLNFRKIGEEEFHHRISFYILKQPSVEAPNRKRRLQTFSNRQARKKKLTKAERDSQLILSAMRKKMQHSKRTGKPIERPGEQLIELPLSISDPEGNPNKGQKSYATKFLETRYKAASPQVFSTKLPWTPQCCILEGMCIINTTPPCGCSTIAGYADYLLNKFIVSEFQKGYSDIHVIFDNPGRIPNNPKYFEQQRRDKAAKTELEGHECLEFNRATTIDPRKWHTQYISCRTCKRSIVQFLGGYFLSCIQPHLLAHQVLYVAGSFSGNLSNTAWFVQGRTGTVQPDPEFSSNAEETDTRIWLHATKTNCTRILIMSTDTDVYHIGLPMRCMLDKEIVVQISQLSDHKLKIMNMKNLLCALEKDPDLASVSRATLPKVLQCLFICTGCDYVSFFSGIGKATFAKIFFQHASFISGGEYGTLADSGEKGFLAFIRLIGTTYFKKNASGFDTPLPSTHFLKFNGTPWQHHLAWLEDIRQTIWYRIKYENNQIASDEALQLHWQRSSWVANMWGQADKNLMTVPPVQDHGWAINSEGMLSIVWDTNENFRVIRERVQALLTGCKCTTGCKNSRCGCVKKNSLCAEGCECQNCQNMGSTHARSPTTTGLETLTLDDETTLLELEETQDELVTDIMDYVFGNESEVPYSQDDESDHSSTDCSETDDIVL